MDVAIIPAVLDDAEAIWSLQRRVYQSEATLYNNPNLPPLTETLDELRAVFESVLFLKAVVDGRLAGSVRVRLSDGTGHIGRLIVEPTHQGRGIGSRLLAAVEAACPAIKRFELFTGHRSERNLRLYERLGYRPFKTVAVNPGLSMVFLEKVIASSHA